VKNPVIFGCYACNEQGQKSDVDFLVEVDSEINPGFATLADRIEIFLDRPVEAASLRSPET
jgi:predicted nucleotidyltransferase